MEQERPQRLRCKGAEHPNVARDLNNLAALLKAKAQDVNHASESRATLLAEAEPLMRRALTIFETSLGPEHPNTQTVARNYASLREALQEHE